jgi:hypothetical protein
MPQNENLSDAWKEELGAEWKRINNTYLHTLGNLTLTGYNSHGCSLNMMVSIEPIGVFT